MGAYPRVASVTAVTPLRLAVTFDNGATRLYDCAALLSRPEFQPLAEPSFFRSVSADRHGFGVFWNDDLDLAESELWLKGASQER